MSTEQSAIDRLKTQTLWPRITPIPRIKPPPTLPLSA